MSWSDHDFRPTASWPNLRRRAELLGRVRRFFDQRGFLEVETPILSADTVIDRHLDPMAIADAEPNGPRWLQTSPEFAMKRLLAAGATAIYQVARVFRRDEVGPLHNPEFTLVEWYRPGDGLDEGIAILSDLCDSLLRRGPAERITYAQAFEQALDLDPHQASDADLRAAAHLEGIVVPESLDPHDRDGWLDLLLTERIQPWLGVERPAVLTDYPPSQAALAVIRPGPPAVAERFELYVNGIELANGYHELLDAEVLRHRNRENNAWRVADGKQPLPETSRLLDAMTAGLPRCAGCALGFDRLAMIALGAGRIEEVIPFPWNRA